jgi:hypothetical protein
MKVLLLALLFATFSFARCAQAAGPQIPCGAAVAQDFPPPDNAPMVGIWHGDTLEQNNWEPPSCTGWPTNTRSRLVVTLMGSFHFDGTIDALLMRVGEISSLRSARYWSTADKKWQQIAYAASALSSPNPKERRPDFSASEFRRDADLYYWENSTRSGDAVYHLKVYESTPDRAVIACDNVTPIRRLFITLFKPSALQSVLIIQRLSPEIFGVYIINRTDQGASFFSDGHEDAYVSRAAALYRQIAGIKTGLEPSAQR